MSTVIHIDNFPNFTAIFEEIERRNKQNRPRAVTAVEFHTPKIHKEERKPRSFTVMPQPESNKRSRLGRRASDPTSDKISSPQPRLRIKSAPCPVIDREKLKDEPRLTEAAKKLSNEELALLYEDILKPLDFYAILFERMKEREMIEFEQICR